MNIDMLPSEIQNKIKYCVLEHPCAKIVKDVIEMLRCNEYHTFRDTQKRVFCKINGRDFFASEYFRKFKKKMDRSIIVYGGVAESDDTDSDDATSSDEYIDEIFNRMFFVSSSSSSDDDD
jgi:hypothetical protein